MNILFLSQRVPYPPNRGDKISTWRICERFSREHNVTVIAFAHVASAFGSTAIRVRINRMIRRMTAAAGLPTLRLVRHRIGPWRLDGLMPGETRTLSNDAAWRQLKAYSSPLD